MPLYQFLAKAAGMLPAIRWLKPTAMKLFSSPCLRSAVGLSKLRWMLAYS
jgi:hypothetical protein